jgi:hypothetical protein
MSAVEYASSDARQHWREVLDAAQEGKAVIVRRDDAPAVVLDASRLRHFLASVVPSRAVLVAEEDQFSIYLEHQPIAANGATLDDAIDEMVAALRTYAVAWHEVLGSSLNHRDNWGLVQLIDLSGDDQLRTWLTSE